MKLVSLYRVRFTYPKGWEVALGNPGSAESQHFYLAEGVCEGRVQGTFQGANHPRRRGDGTFEPNFQGIIQTVDGEVRASERDQVELVVDWSELVWEPIEP